MIGILADVRTDCTCPAKPEARVLIGVGSRRRQARYWFEFATMKGVPPSAPVQTRLDGRGARLSPPGRRGVTQALVEQTRCRGRQYAGCPLRPGLQSRSPGCADGHQGRGRSGRHLIRAQDGSSKSEGPSRCGAHPLVPGQVRPPSLRAICSCLLSIQHGCHHVAQWHAGLQTDGKQSRAADLALNKQCVGRRHMPCAPVSEDGF